MKDSQLNSSVTDDSGNEQSEEDDKNEVKESNDPDRYSVAEEAPGVRWEPKGGEYYLPDFHPTEEELMTPREQDELRGVETLAPASRPGIDLESVAPSGNDPLEVERTVARYLFTTEVSASPEAKESARLAGRQRLLEHLEPGLEHARSSRSKPVRGEARPKKNGH